MGSDLDYAWEKTLVAVEILCTSQGSIEERLIRAWADSLSRLRMHPIQTADLRQQFDDIADYFVVLPGGSYGLTGLPWEEQARIASEILHLHFDIRDRNP